MEMAAERELVGLNPLGLNKFQLHRSKVQFHLSSLSLELHLKFHLASRRFRRMLLMNRLRDRHGVCHFDNIRKSNVALVFEYLALAEQDSILQLPNFWAQRIFCFRIFLS
jgi:hypothetical protein